MGEYFDIVCHDCRVYYRPDACKLREIALNIPCAMAVGHFCTQHAGHRLELRGDERTYLHEYTEAVVARYKKADIYRDDGDATLARDGFKAMRAMAIAADAALGGE